MTGNAVGPRDRRTGTGLVWICITAASGVAGHVVFLWRASNDENSDPYTAAYSWPMIPIAGLGLATVVLGIALAVRSGGSVRRLVLAILGCAVGAAVACLALWILWIFSVEQPLID